ncbi:hypothetical protein FACS1894124_5060 [Spirochaetia bacterium]|nr:hypothetical protein FACS1894124_5060 [Spirochaetia bacterium]
MFVLQEVRKIGANEYLGVLRQEEKEGGEAAGLLANQTGLPFSKGYGEMIVKNIRVWRETVLNNARHICHECGREGNTAHHIKTRREWPDLILETDNGMCLCSKCHGKIHIEPNKVLAEQRKMDRIKDYIKKNADWHYYSLVDPFCNKLSVISTGILMRLCIGNGYFTFTELLSLFNESPEYLKKCLDRMVSEGLIGKRYGAESIETNEFWELTGDDI